MTDDNDIQMRDWLMQMINKTIWENSYYFQITKIDWGINDLGYARTNIEDANDAFIAIGHFANPDRLDHYYYNNDAAPKLFNLLRCKKDYFAVSFTLICPEFKIDENKGYLKEIVNFFQKYGVNPISNAYWEENRDGKNSYLTLVMVTDNRPILFIANIYDYRIEDSVGQKEAVDLFDKVYLFGKLYGDLNYLKKQIINIDSSEKIIDSKLNFIKDFCAKLEDPAYMRHLFKDTIEHAEKTPYYGYELPQSLKLIMPIYLFLDKKNLEASLWDIGDMQKKRGTFSELVQEDQFNNKEDLTNWSKDSTNKKVLNYLADQL